MKKAQIKFFISLTALIILNIIAYQLTIKILTYRPWMVVGGIIFLLSLVLNIFILYYAVKAHNLSILFVLLYWILAFVNNFRIYIMMALPFGSWPLELINAMDPLIIGLLTGLYSLQLPIKITNKTILRILGPLNEFPLQTIIRIFICFIFIVISMCFLIRQLRNRKNYTIGHN